MNKLTGKFFAFVIGVIDPFRDREAADRAVEFIKKLPGLVGVHPNADYTVLVFDTLENAITSRAIYTETGNQAAYIIMNAEIGNDGVLMIQSPAYDSRDGARWEGNADRVN